MDSEIRNWHLKIKANLRSMLYEGSIRYHLSEFIISKFLRQSKLQHNEAGIAMVAKQRKERAEKRHIVETILDVVRST